MHIQVWNLQQFLHQTLQIDIAKVHSCQKSTTYKLPRSAFLPLCNSALYRRQDSTYLRREAPNVDIQVFLTKSGREQVYQKCNRLVQLWKWKECDYESEVRVNWSQEVVASICEGNSTRSKLQQRSCGVSAPYIINNTVASQEPFMQPCIDMCWASF